MAVIISNLMFISLSARNIYEEDLRRPPCLPSPSSFAIGKLKVSLHGLKQACHSGMPCALSLNYLYTVIQK